MKISKKMGVVLIMLIFVTIILISNWQSNKKTKIIKANMGIVIGEITNSSSAHRGGVVINYAFHYNGLFQNDKTMGIYSGTRDYFLMKTFPVVFSKSQPEINEILILPDDFEKYGLQYPDSLIWVKSY